LSDRRLRISFERERVSVLANLLEEDAPNTSNAIWNALPIRTTVIHDIWSGHLVFLHLNLMIKLPPENLLTYLPTVGDVFYYYRPPHYFRGSPYGRIEDAEIGIVYDRDSRPQGPRGPKAVNLFANIPKSELNIFQKVCERILYEGSKDIEIAKA
jgi:hypothetical protein